MERRTNGRNGSNPLTKMRKLIIYFIPFLVVALSSCEKQQEGSQSTEIVLPSGNYILFSPKIETKAVLVNDISDMNPKAFYVWGYQYSNTTEWTVARPTAKPNLFWNKEVSYEDGIWVYEDLQDWDLYSKYAFFAFYPGTVNGQISVTTQDHVNVPKVTYTLPLSSDRNNPADPAGFYDLMTASAINKKASDGIITFEFQHRLFCIEVVGQNNDDEDHVISDLKFELDDVAFGEMTVPMRKGDQMAPVEKENRTGKAIFSILSGDEKLTLPSDKTEVSFTENETLANNDNILLIPQDSRESNFRGTLYFKLDGADVQASFDAPLNYIEAYKYKLTMSIIGGNVLLTMNNPVSWEVQPDVNFDFE